MINSKILPVTFIFLFISVMCFSETENLSFQKNNTINCILQDNQKVETSTWNGFELLDSTLNGIPFKIVFPEKANNNRNWIWRARFWGHEPQTDIALLEKGFHLVYIEVGGLFGSPKALKIWDDFYAFVTQKYQLNSKVVLEGMSRGGLVIFNWGNQNADKVACIYGDAPVCDFKSWPGGKYTGKGSPQDWENCLKQYGLNEHEALEFKGNPIDHLENLAQLKVPILIVVGDADDVVPVSENAEKLKARLEELAWNMEIIHKPGVGHHPHSLVDPKPIVDFILKYTNHSQEDSQVPFKFFYVSPDGSDYNIGSIQNPVATFEGAQKLVQKFKKANPKIPINVYFRGGKYYRTQPAIFNAEDGGTREAPVKYLAFPGEVPLILGGKQLQLKWEEYKNKIYVAKIPDGLIFESLFINDEEQILARYPNYNSDVRIFNGTAADCISAERVNNWKNPVNGYFHVIHKARWGGFHYRITGKDKNENLEMEGGWQNNRPENGIHDKLRYVENIFEELDTTKEWYLDREKNLLYFKPGQKINLETAKVEVAFLENLISITGTEEKPVEYLSFDGFHFNRSNRTFMKTREILLRSDWTIYRGGAILLEGTENCEIKNCEFSQIGSNAVFINAYNRHSKVEGCHFYDIGASPICFVGDTSAVRNPKFIPYGPPVSEEELDLTPGPKNNKFPKYCAAKNNLIHDFGKIEKQVAGIQISMAAFITVAHNSIYDCPRAGINISEGAWGGHIIEFNDVFNTVLETSDHGSFNSWGRDRFWMVANGKTEARAEANRAVIMLDFLAPTIIRNNRMRCDHGWDIDLDDGSSYYHIYNNLCLNKGIKLREGYYRKVENNICINNAMHPHVWLKNNGDIIRGNIFTTKFFPIRVEYWGTEIDYNWYINKNALEEQHKLGLDKNSLTGNPEFVDAQNGDFTVKPESKLFKMGWKNFPMDAFGVQKEELKKLSKKPEIPDLKIEINLGSPAVDFYGGRIKNLETDEEVSATGMHDKIGVLIVEPPVYGDFSHLEFQKGDVILKVNKVAINNVKMLKTEMAKGKVKSFSIWRNQKNIQL